jgi:thiol-disulfide isomerase/thioredoxin
MPRPPIIPTIDWQAVFASAMDYPTWIATGESPENRARMEETRTSLHLDPQLAGYLAALPRRVHVLAIAEDWCGDVVRHVPALARLAEAAPNLQVRFITREQHPEVFVRFLTNGGEAIPKLIFLNQAWVECGNWGPMPAPCRELIARGKACGDVAAARKKVAAILEADAQRRMTIQELMALIETASALEP